MFAIGKAISLKRRLAPAVLTVVDGKAFSSRSANVCPAHRDTPLATIVTSFRLTAIIIFQAANLSASHNWISLQTRRTVAESNMALYSALCSLTTADAVARVHTLMRNAGLGQRTVIVCDTLICKYFN